jgi:hypothetical protein
VTTPATISVPPSLALAHATMWVGHPAFDSNERFQHLANIFCASPCRPTSVDLYTGHIWQSRNHNAASGSHCTMDSDMVAGFQTSDFEVNVPIQFVIAVAWNDHQRHLPFLGILARVSLMWMEILLTRPLSRSLNRSTCLVEYAAVALFLISITSSSRITAQLSDESTLVWDSVPLLAHNARFKATKQCT